MYKWEWKITIKTDRKLAECEGGEEPGNNNRALIQEAGHSISNSPVLTLSCSFSTIHFTYLSLENI